MLNKNIIVVLFACFFAATAKSTERGATVTVRSSYVEVKDTLEMYVWSDLIAYNANLPHKKIYAVNKNGKYYFRIDSVSSNCFISLAFSYQKSRGTIIPIIEFLRLHSGDDIEVELTPKKGKYQPSSGFDNGLPIFEDNWEVLHKGKGASKMTIGHYFRKRFKEPYGTSLRNEVEFRTIAAKTLENIDSFHRVLLKELVEKKIRLKDGDYEQACMDITGFVNLQKINSISRYKALRPAPKEEVNFVIDSLIGSFKQFNAADYRNLVYAPDMIEAWAELALIKMASITGSYRINPSVIIPVLEELVIDPTARSRVFASVFVSRYKGFPDPEIIAAIRPLLTDTYAAQIVDSYMQFTFGKKMIDFSLPNQDGAIHKFSDYRGNVVLLDFWYMGCIPCRKYIESVITPLSQTYKDDPKVKIILVSLDDHKTLKRLIEEGVVPEGVETLYTANEKFTHPLIEKLNIPSYPYPFLINTKGEIVAAGGSDKTVKDLELLTKKIEELKK